MKKNKRRLTKKAKNLVQMFLLSFFVLSLSFFIQRKVNFKNIPVEVSYYTESTLKVYTSSMGMVGDSLIHEAVYYWHRTNNGYDFSSMLAPTCEKFKNYDIAYYNQETMLGGTSLGLSGYPQFNSPQEVGEAFVNCGFDLVSLATNHSLDGIGYKGTKVIDSSRTFWNQKEKESENGLIATGSWSSAEEREEIKILERNGIKYAFLSYTVQTNGLNYPSGKDYVVNVYSNEKAKNDVEKYKPLVDCIIVAMHWGNEYVYEPNWQQKEIAKYLSDLGVNIIVGCHPHVIEPIDFVGDTLVIYSLGNFVSAQDEAPRLIGLLADCVIRKEVYHGKTKIIISDVGAELLFTQKGSKYVVYPWDQVTDSIYYTNYEMGNSKSYWGNYFKGIVQKYRSDINVRGV